MVCQMEGNNKVSGGGENGSSSDGRPPIPLNAAYQNYFSAGHVPLTCRKTLVRHPSLVMLPLCQENHLISTSPPKRVPIKTHLLAFSKEQVAFLELTSLSEEN